MILQRPGSKDEGSKRFDCMYSALCKKGRINDRTNVFPDKDWFHYWRYEISWMKSSVLVL